MVTDAPQAMSENEYIARVHDEWKALLNSDPDLEERAVQHFLEMHPSLIPGAFLTEGRGKSGHWPVPAAVISQPKLPGGSEYIPDFLWIAKDSATVSPVLVELERPGKRWFTASGQPTAGFTQAQDQITNWKIWMNDPNNQNIFREYFGLTDDLWRNHTFSPQYILIYGRNSEFEGKDDLNKKRSRLRRNGEYLFTLDSLTVDRNANGLICVKMDGKRQFRAISWPAICTHSPSVSPLRKDFTGLEDAITASTWITPERREFLISRLQYWADWSKSPSPGITGFESE